MTATVVEGYAVRLAGLDLEQVDSQGVEWHAHALAGWDGSPEPRLDLLPRSADHGSYPSQAFYAERKLTLEGGIVGTTPTACAAAVARFSALTSQLAGVELRVTEPGFDRSCTVWRAGPLDVARLGSFARYSLPLVAPDPVRYGNAALAPFVDLPPADSVTSGFAYPFVYPMTYGSGTANTGDLVVTNDGDATVWPVLRITGPVTNPTVRNVTTGDQLTLTIDLAAGDYLDVDTREHTVLLNGTASRRTAVQPGSRFPSVTPGASQWSFRGTGTGRLALSYRSGWY